MFALPIRFILSAAALPTGEVPNSIVSYSNGFDQDAEKNQVLDSLLTTIQGIHKYSSIDYQIR
ncbi:hypothetical protein Leryth_024074 [Lithospermum erythrorhizon]|nr:hypothetical protein Leryth_024074 [Lithospermum erythrorhizon]